MISCKVVFNREFDSIKLKFKKSNYLQIFLLDNNKHFFNSYYDSDPYYKVKPTLGFTPCSLRPEEKISRHLKETAITKRLFR